MILSKTSFKKNEDGIIFQNYLGNYLTLSTVQESSEKYCVKASVEYKGTTYLQAYSHSFAIES